MAAHSAPVDRRQRTRVRLLASAVLAGLGALLLVLGSCSSATPPPSPNSANAGSIDGEPTTAASPTSSDSSSVTSSTSSSAPTSRPSSAAPEPAGTSSSAAGSKTPAPGSPASTAPVPNDPGSDAPGPGTPKAPTLNTSLTPLVPAAGPVLAESAPTTLTIPAIGVTDSPVLTMGRAADGTIEVPPLDDTKSSGWYKNSPTPGELGPSILLGHVDSAANGPSVFYKLGNLKPGDEIEVGRQDGTVAVFKVDGVREYSKAEFPTQTVYGNLDHAGLRLITCGGAFNPDVGHYESNIIAFASLVSSRQA